jgi:hypothetical protein
MNASRPGRRDHAGRGALIDKQAWRENNLRFILSWRAERFGARFARELPMRSLTDLELDLVAGGDDPETGSHIPGVDTGAATLTGGSVPGDGAGAPHAPGTGAKPPVNDNPNLA